MSISQPDMMFLDVREALLELVDGKTFAGRQVSGWFHLPADFVARATTGETPLVLIYTTGGTQGWIDRVDRATVEVFAPGTDAVQILEAIRADIVGDAHDLAAGYVDDISCDVTPHEVPFASDVVNQARMSLLVTSRPRDTYTAP